MFKPASSRVSDGQEFASAKPVSAELYSNMGPVLADRISTISDFSTTNPRVLVDTLCASVDDNDDVEPQQTKASPAKMPKSSSKPINIELPALRNAQKKFIEQYVPAQPKKEKKRSLKPPKAEKARSPAVNML
jgi:hypothetical protein